MSGTLVLTGGKDPLTDDDGHSSYVRAHGLAARRAGYRPIVLCAGESAAVTETAFGTVVRCATRVRPVRNLMLLALQRDLIVIPKSAHRERIRENADVFGFELPAEEVARLEALDEGLVTGWDPTQAP